MYLRRHISPEFFAIRHASPASLMLWIAILGWSLFQTGMLVARS